MTMMKKAVVSACIVLMLISACIGPAAATINIWGADSTSKDSQTNDPAYNAKIAAENAQWYYDSENHVLWTEGGSDLVLPVYMNITSDDTTTNIWGYNLTLEGTGTSFANLVAQKGAYKAASEIQGAKISASVSETEGTAITSTNPVNIVNASFDATNVGSYSIELTNAKLATGTNTINKLSDLSRDTPIENINNVIAFKVMTKPFVDYFTIANDEKRKNSTAGGTLYFYYERDHADSGTLLTANITNMDTTEKFDWKLNSGGSGALILELADKNANPDNFTTVNLSGTKAVGAYNNSVANVTIKRTGESRLVNVNATYWNQSVSVVDDQTVTGNNITFTYNVSAVPGAYVTNAGGNEWDTYVQLYPVGPYQNYTIPSQNIAGYTIKNSTTTNDKDVKNLTITASSYNGGEGPIQIPLESGINGDPNEDGIVDIIDGAGVGIETIRVASSGTSILKTAQQQFLADVNKDGIVTVVDVLAIHAYIVDQ